jgi:hypothetical protein
MELNKLYKPQGSYIGTIYNNLSLCSLYLFNNTMKISRSIYNILIRYTNYAWIIYKGPVIYITNGEEYNDSKELTEKHAQTQNQQQHIDFSFKREITYNNKDINTECLITADISHCINIPYSPVINDASNNRIVENPFLSCEINIDPSGVEDKWWCIDLNYPYYFFLDGNIILDKTFVHWYLQKYHGLELQANTLNYEINIMDKNVNIITINPDQYVLITRPGSDIKISPVICDKSLGYYVIDNNKGNDDCPYSNQSFEGSLPQKADSEISFGDDLRRRQHLW